VPELSPSERKIIELCGKVVALQDADELKAAVDELKAAIHQHLADAKGKMAALAVIVSLADERSKAAA
jgi:hypothetical protein